MQMVRVVLVWIIFAFVLLIGCQSNTKNVKEVYMYNPSGDMIGTANLSEQPDGVKILLEVEGLTPGFHGIHVHEYPQCEGPDFKSAGNHFNPEGEEHGLMHPEGAHLGDLPNIEADHDGQVDDELMLEDATLLSGKNSILEGEGTSLIINAEQDDGVSQPGGDAGERIACGIISEDDETVEPPTDPTKTNEEFGDE